MHCSGRATSPQKESDHQDEQARMGNYVVPSSRRRENHFSSSFLFPKSDRCQCSIGNSQISCNQLIHCPYSG